jgi:hypothetical protein
MAFSKTIVAFIKEKRIYNYGKRSFRTISTTFSEINNERVSSKETHFGFETVKESEKAEKGMTNKIIFIASN